MQLDTVMQLQTLSEMMREQFALCEADSVMVLGIAGGNGLEHAERCAFERIYGVDINPDYLKRCAERYPRLDGVLQRICADLTAPYTARCTKMNLRLRCGRSVSGCPARQRERCRTERNSCG